MAHTIRILSINNIVQLAYNFNGKTFLSIFLLIPRCSIDRDREMKLTVSGESISRCEKAEYSQQIRRRKYKQTTASPHNNPLSLHTRFLLRLFHHHSLKHYQHTDTEIFRIRSLRFAVVFCHDSFFLSFETDDFDNRQAGRIDQQQQQQQSSHTMY